jgi:hypothetical protein
MTPDETAAAASQYLTLYVEGGRNSTVLASFPEAANSPGIFLRCPAVLGPAPEYEVPEVSPYDCQLFAASDGPEVSSEPYVFVDRCPVVRVRVQQAGIVLTVSFDCIVDFPAADFPVALPFAASDLAGRRVLLPVSMAEPNRIAAECVARMQEYLGVESTQLSFFHEVVLMRHEDYNGTLA